MTITAETLLAAAAGKVVPKLPDGVALPAGNTLLVTRWHDGAMYVPHPAVALALTVTALEDALPPDWRVVREVPKLFAVQHHLPGIGWEYDGELYPTRAAALMDLLGRLEARDAS